jgi:tetratricopeptide (TPR) repeat protein
VSGRPAPIAACLLALLAALSAASAPAWALGDTEITANQGVAAGGSITGSTITVGMPPAQVQALVVTFTRQLGVAAEARAKAEAQAAQLATQLGFTREAVIGFFGILGEQEVPLERMPTKLGEIAQRYQGLLARLQTTSSTDPEVQRLKGKARAALDAGDFARTEELLNQAKARDLAAIKQMRAVMERVQADLDARQLSAAEAAAENGNLMMTRIRYADAARYYAEAVGLTPERHAEQLSKHLTDWAEAAGRAGDYWPALDAARRALALDEARLPADDALLGSRLNNLAALHQDTGRFAAAEPLMERAIAIREKTLGPEHPNTAASLTSLAVLYLNTGRLAEAEPLFKSMLSIFEKALGGSEHPIVATTTNNLALLYQNTGRLAEAEPLFRRSITIFEKTLPPDHPRLTRVRENYARLFDQLGRHDEAAKLRVQAQASR